MREITEHIVTEGDKAVRIEVLDEPGVGGASHAYDCVTENGTLLIHFQNGPIKEAGVNGLTHEVLLAIVIDRLRGFQKGNFTCRENAIALTHIEEALMWLQSRTRKRQARGVEGTFVI